MILNLYRNDDVNLVQEEMSFFATLPLFTDFRFLGWTKDQTTDEEGPIGYESTDGDWYIPVFINNFASYPVSDDEEIEQEAIDNGKNCAIFFHGAGTSSYVMRFTTKEIKLIDLSFFDDKDVDNAFFYRST